MKKTVLTAAIAVVLGAGLGTPAHAADSRHEQWIELQSVGSFTTDPIRFAISLLLPAVQAAREAAR